jgi:hypothetical protein
MHKEMGSSRGFEFFVPRPRGLLIDGRGIGRLLAHRRRRSQTFRRRGKTVRAALRNIPVSLRSLSRGAAGKASAARCLSNIARPATESVAIGSNADIFATYYSAARSRSVTGHCGSLRVAVF